MPWTYRLIQRTDRTPTGDSETYIVLTELFSFPDGTQGWASEPVWPQGDTANDIKADLRRMLAACDKPVLEEHGGTLREVTAETPTPAETDQ